MVGTGPFRGSRGSGATAKVSKKSFSSGLPVPFALCSPAPVQQFFMRSIVRFTALAAAATALLPCAKLHAEPADPVSLTAREVEQVIAQAATKASLVDRNAIIAVVDREGFLLGLWNCDKSPGSKVPRVLPPFTLNNLAVVKLYGLVGAAITRASTAAFLSSDQNAFTTRTAGFIIQQHFPPGVRNTSPGPLVGVGFSSLFFTDVNRVKLIPDGFQGSRSVADLIADGTIILAPRAKARPNADPGFSNTASFGDLSPGVRAPLFPLTSLDDGPGGVPLYKGGHLVGGVGVTGDGDTNNLAPAAALLFDNKQPNATTGFKTGHDTDEDVALAGQTGFRPPKEIVATNVLIVGFRVPYVFPALEDIQDIDDVPPLGTIGRPIDIPVPLLNTNQGIAGIVPNQALMTITGDGIVEGNPKASPDAYPYEVARFGGFEGQIRFPLRDDPLLHDGVPANDFIGSARRLQKEDVKSVLSLVAARARITRAGIRLPLGTNAKIFITVINNPDKPGEIPQILGVYRTGEATVFSWDVSAQKARTALFFSNTQLAMSSRSVGFLAQRFFPPGIDGTQHGPYFGFQEAVTLKFRPVTDVTNGAFPFPGNPNVPNGITVFPGGFPLYKDGFLVGAVGISGDGVDQDDIMAISGTEDFRPEPEIRADVFTYRGARLPYVKFPRDPVK